MPKKLTYEYVKEYIEKEGYVLLSTEYINNKSKLHIQCDKNHIYDAHFNSFYNGCRCSYCFGTPKHTYEYVKEYVEKEGFVLLSNHYSNNHQLLDLECDKGHKCKIRFDNFKNGTRCSVCTGTKKYSFNEVCKYIKSQKYKVISIQIEYKNVNTPIKMLCSNNHVYISTFHNFKRGYRCPKCNFSGEEKNVLQYVKSIYKGTIIENDKSQLINPTTNHWLELDIWMPETKKAIEYNGYYHTMEDHSKRDIIKQMMCDKQNIGLLVIQSNDWKKNKESVIKGIQKFLV